MEIRATKLKSDDDHRAVHEGESEGRKATMEWNGSTETKLRGESLSSIKNRIQGNNAFDLGAIMHDRFHCLGLVYKQGG